MLKATAKGQSRPDDWSPQRPTIIAARPSGSSVTRPPPVPVAAWINKPDSEEAAH